MEHLELPPAAQQFANDFLVWIGFGTLVGLLAKAIMPGRDPGGAMTTLLMGIAGVIMGCGVVSYITAGKRLSPISPVGLVVGTIGAFVILGFYRLLGGYWMSNDGRLIRSAGHGPAYPYRSTRRRRRREYDYDEA